MTCIGTPVAETRAKRGADNTAVGTRLWGRAVAAGASGAREDWRVDCHDDGGTCGSEDIFGSEMSRGLREARLVVGLVEWWV